MGCMCGGCGDCMRAQGYYEEDEEDDMDATEVAEHALREGRMPISEYIDLYARNYLDSLDLKLLYAMVVALEGRADARQIVIERFERQLTFNNRPTTIGDRS